MVACHDRLDVFKVFCLNIQELRKDFDVNVTVCTSDIGVYSYASEWGVNSVVKMRDNKPLGRKRNEAVAQAKKYDSDIYINSAEDHIINKAYIDRLLFERLNGYESMGTYDEFFYDYSKDESIFFKGYRGPRIGELTGIGKAYTRGMLQKMNWRMVDDNENGSLDLSNHNILKGIKHKTHKFFIDKDMMLLDLKNGNTLNSIDALLKAGAIRVNKNRIFKHLPESVVKAIKEL